MFKFFSGKQINNEALFAYKGRVPDFLEVSIRSSQDKGYIISVENFKGCITQSENGKEIFEMVNDALYTYLEIPEFYRPYLPAFLPPEAVRKEFNITIPVKYLKEGLVLQRV